MNHKTELPKGDNFKNEIICCNEFSPLCIVYLVIGLLKLFSLPSKQICM